MTKRIFRSILAVSLAVVLASFVLICLLAGKIYKNMALYKGQVPGFSTILKMIKS